MDRRKESYPSYHRTCDIQETNRRHRRFLFLSQTISSHKKAVFPHMAVRHTLKHVYSNCAKCKDSAPYTERTSVDSLCTYGVWAAPYTDSTCVHFLCTCGVWPAHTLKEHLFIPYVFVVYGWCHTLRASTSSHSLCACGVWPAPYTGRTSVSVFPTYLWCMACAIH